MICTVTVNPAIDRMIYLSELNLDNTNRIKDIEEVLGGKGTHVSVNLGILGHRNKAFGVDFGKNGHRIEEMLSESEIEMEFLHYEEGKSRMNYALIEDNQICTLLSEKGQIISLEQSEALLKKIYDEVQEGDILVLSGDASNSEIPMIYPEIMKRVADKGVKVFLDSSSENLKEGLKWKPFLIKPNEDELTQIYGRKIEGEEAIIEAIKDLTAKGIQCVAVSCGGNGSYVGYEGKIYRIYPLKVDVKNTIGCGDAFLSGLAYGFDKKMKFEDILRYAAAVSSATAEDNSTVGFDKERALELLDKVVIETL